MTFMPSHTARAHAHAHRRGHTGGGASPKTKNDGDTGRAKRKAEKEEAHTHTHTHVAYTRHSQRKFCTASAHRRLKKRRRGRRRPFPSWGWGWAARQSRSTSPMRSTVDSTKRATKTPVRASLAQGSKQSIHPLPPLQGKMPVNCFVLFWSFHNISIGSFPSEQRKITVSCSQTHTRFGQLRTCALVGVLLRACLCVCPFLSSLSDPVLLCDHEPTLPTPAPPPQKKEAVAWARH